MCTHKEILVSLKQGRNSGTCCNVDEAWGHDAKGNKLAMKRQRPIDFTHMRYLEEEGREGGVV